MTKLPTHYDVIIIGGGHAGTEAAWAAASGIGRPALPAGRICNNEEHTSGSENRSTTRVALITMDPARIGQMSCNPAIGGLAKGQMVREIDALGGIMGRAIDATGIMFKMLNTSKGAAVRGPRAQADKYAYMVEVQRLLSLRKNIDVIAATVEDIIVENDTVVGVQLPAGAGVVDPDPDRTRDWLQRGQAHGSEANFSTPPSPIYPSRAESTSQSKAPQILRGDAVVLTTGTFMRGLMHTGKTKTSGGRVGEQAAIGISGTLQKLGFQLGRLKTGTPPRLAQESIDWDSLEGQSSDNEPVPFSDLSPDILPAKRFPNLPQTQCRITHTTESAHELIRQNLHRAPMYAGRLDAECGPRYCPSIEDKVVRFENRTSHHVFLEPESLWTNEIYCNGISTSLPIDVQERIIRSMPGCANAEVLKWGYAVEYDMVWPNQLDATCMTKSIRGLFFAGQINCTTGYEEAGGQGLLAGLNAARYAAGEELSRPGRDQCYIGVMLDDLVTKTPREPYRMFTSRAEYRLLLRADNADERLTPLGRELGLIDETRWRAFEERHRTLNEIRESMRNIRMDGKTLWEVARRPETTTETIASKLPRFDQTNGHDGYTDDRIELLARAITEARYSGYLDRLRADIKRLRENERMKIPAELNFESITGLRGEAAEVLTSFRPATMGQAGRLAGVNPADLTLLAVAIQKRKAS